MEVQIIPALNRVKHVAQLYAEFDLVNAGLDHSDRVGRTVFYAIAHQLTSKELRRRSGVYEFANQHGFHNFRRIKGLITTICEMDQDGIASKANWLNQAEALEAFLRQEYKCHVRSSVDPNAEELWIIDSNGKCISPKRLIEKLKVCNTHSRAFALQFAPESAVSAVLGCSKCAGILQFFKDLKSFFQRIATEISPSVRESIETRLLSCEKSVKLYMAHIVRTTHQV